MAKDLIRLSGLEPDIDIPLVFTGLRPGEKLYEELQLLNEQKVSTSHRKIMILKDKKNHMPWAILKPSIEELILSAKNLDSEKIQMLLDQIIPTYRPRNFGSHKESIDSMPRVISKAEA